MKDKTKTQGFDRNKCKLQSDFISQFEQKTEQKITL
jgi:hypothetical protein